MGDREAEERRTQGQRLADTELLFAPDGTHTAAIAVIRLVSFTTALLMRRDAKCSCETLLSSCQRPQQPQSVA